MDRTRLLLVDDHVLFRESLGRLLAVEPDFQVVGQCGQGSEALEFLAREPADLILLDFNLPDGLGTTVIPPARKAGYEGRFLLVTGSIDAEASTDALQNGVSGIFLKHNPAGSLLRAIRMVIAGDVWLDPKVIDYLAVRSSRPAMGDLTLLDSMTERERGVINGLLEGLTNKHIAERLSSTEGAVKSTIQTLFERTGVRTRSQLVRIVLERTGGKGQ